MRRACSGSALGWPAPLNTHQTEYSFEAHDAGSHAAQERRGSVRCSTGGTRVFAGFCLCLMAVCALMQTLHKMMQADC